MPPSEIQYEMIRVEAIERIRMRQGIILGLSIFFATLSGFSFQESHLLVFLYPISALVVSVVWGQHHIRIGILASFLQQYYEKPFPLDYSWEEFMSAERNRSHRLFHDVRFSHGAVIFATQFLAIGVAYLAFYFDTPNPEQAQSVGNTQDSTTPRGAIPDTLFFVGTIATLICMVGTGFIIWAAGQRKRSFGGAAFDRLARLFKFHWLVTAFRKR